jgi:hypothetical protein
MRDAERLWESSRQGAGATQAVIAEIQAKLNGAGAAAETFAGRVRTAIDGIPREIDIEVNGHYNAPEIDGGNPGYAVGTKGRHNAYFVDFGQGTNTRLHGYEAVITPEQAPGFVAEYLKRNPNTTPPAIHVLVEMTADGRVTAQRTISAREFLRREMQQLLRAGALSVPQAALGTV